MSEEGQHRFDWEEAEKEEQQQEQQEQTQSEDYGNANDAYNTENPQHQYDDAERFQSPNSSAATAIPSKETYESTAFDLSAYASTAYVPAVSVNHTSLYHSSESQNASGRAVQSDPLLISTPQQQQASPLYAPSDRGSVISWVDSDASEEQALAMSSADFAVLAAQAQAEHVGRAVRNGGVKRKSAGGSAPAKAAFAAGTLFLPTGGSKKGPWPLSEAGSSGKKQLPHLQPRLPRHIFAGTQLDFSPDGKKSSAVDPAILAAIHAPLTPPPAYQQRSLTNSASSPNMRSSASPSKKGSFGTSSASVLRPNPSSWTDDPLALKDHLWQTRRALSQSEKNLTQSKTEILRLRNDLRKRDKELNEILTRKIGEGTDTSSGGLQLLKSERTLIQSMLIKMRDLEEKLNQTEEEKERLHSTLQEQHTKLMQISESAIFFEQEAKRLMDLLRKARAHKDLSKFLQGSQNLQHVETKDVDSTLVEQTLLTFHQNENKQLLTMNKELQLQLQRMKKQENKWFHTESEYTRHLSESRELIQTTYTENEILRRELSETQSTLREASIDLLDKDTRLSRHIRDESIMVTQRGKLMREVSQLTTALHQKKSDYLALATAFRLIGGKHNQIHNLHVLQSAIDDAESERNMEMNGEISSSSTHQNRSKTASPKKGRSPVRIKQTQPLQQHSRPATAESRVVDSFVAAASPTYSPHTMDKRQPDLSQPPTQQELEEEEEEYPDDNPEPTPEPEAILKPTSSTLPAKDIEKPQSSEKSLANKSSNKPAPNLSPATVTPSVSGTNEPEKSDDDYDDEKYDESESELNVNETPSVVPNVATKHVSHASTASSLAVPSPSSCATDSSRPTSAQTNLLKVEVDPVSRPTSAQPVIMNNVIPPRQPAPPDAIGCDTCTSAAILMCQDCECTYCQDCYEDLHKSVRTKQHQTIPLIHSASPKDMILGPPPIKQPVNADDAAENVDRDDEYEDDAIDAPGVDAPTTSSKPTPATDAAASVAPTPAPAATSTISVRSVLSSKSDALAALGPRSDFKSNTSVSSIPAPGTAPLCMHCTGALVSVVCVSCQPPGQSCDQCDEEIHVHRDRKAHQRRKFVPSTTEILTAKQAKKQTDSEKAQWKEAKNAADEAKEDVQRVADVASPPRDQTIPVVHPASPKDMILGPPPIKQPVNADDAAENVDRDDEYEDDAIDAPGVDAPTTSSKPTPATDAAASVAPTPAPAATSTISVRSVLSSKSDALAALGPRSDFKSNTSVSSIPAPGTAPLCMHCTGALVSVVCVSCQPPGQSCDQCDEEIHVHRDRKAHQRRKFVPSTTEILTAKQAKKQTDSEKAQWKEAKNAADEAKEDVQRVADVASSPPLCDVCESSVAILRCPSCCPGMLLMCVECDQSLHELGEAIKHRRENIDVIQGTAASSSGNKNEATGSSVPSPAHVEYDPTLSVTDKFQQQEARDSGEPAVAGPLPASHFPHDVFHAPAAPVCSNCDASIATTRCTSGCGDLCGECSVEMHSRGVLRKHVLEAMGDESRPSSRAEGHPPTTQKDEAHAASANASAAASSAPSKSKPVAMTASVQLGGELSDSSSEDDGDDDD